MRLDKSHGQQNTDLTKSTWTASEQISSGTSLW